MQCALMLENCAGAKCADGGELWWYNCVDGGELCWCNVR